MGLAALGRRRPRLVLACAAAAQRDSRGQISHRTWIASGLSMTRQEAAEIVAGLQEIEQDSQMLVTVTRAG